MIADEVRMCAYSRALRDAVGPDSIVLDIGAGTGILSLLACQYGARKVYAVEPKGAIAVAEAAARANGFADRIECIQALSTRINLPQRADVIVSDLRGVLPLFEQHLPSIIDARRRLLAPGGKLIPKRDVLWAAVVETPQDYDPLIKPWLRERFELNMEAASQMVTNVWKKARVTPEQLLTKPYCWAIIDYLTVESPDVSAEITFQVARTGTAHGFVVWFDAVLEDGIEFSNAPGQPELIYGSYFFPWSSPVDLAADDAVSLNLRADLVGSDYVWSWETRVYGNDRVRPKAHFRQSTFLGAPLSPAQLRKRGGRYQPRLREDGEIDRQILQLMDGARSNEEIAQLVAGWFPSRFPSHRDALTRVGELSKRYSQ
jgi:type I protein arginine methyltransferase